MRTRLAAAVATVAMVTGIALPVGAGSDIQVSRTEGPSGTVVSISNASDALSGGSARCTLPVTLKMVPVADAQKADLAGGAPFTPPDGDFTVPPAPAGDYSVVVVCDGSIGTDSFPFRVTVAPIAASPNVAG